MTRSVRAIAKVAIALGFATLAAREVPCGAAADETTPRDVDAANPYAGLTDQQWTQVVKRWERLDDADRRWFLTEARKRNSRNRRRAAGEGGLAIAHRERARFGNVANPRKSQSPDGRSKEKPAPDDAKAYGLGFERRQRARLGGPGNRNGEAPRGNQPSPADAVPHHSPRNLDNAP